MNRLFTQKVLAGIYFLLIVTLGGCMQLPAARDDLSVLGNDPFSNLIRGAYLEKIPEVEMIRGNAGAHTGVARIDKTKAQEIALNALRGKSALDVIVLFERDGGFCLPLSSDVKEKILTCQVDRKWKLKNIGAPFDTKYWSDPAAKLIFKITLSETDVVVGVALDIVDITVKIPIHSKPNYISKDK